MEIYAPEVFNGAKLLGLYEPGSAEWHAERSRGIGGSEVGTILGLNPYESAYALWAKKLGKIPSEIKENWAIRFGKAFESPILALLQEEHPGWQIFETGTYQSAEHSFMHANPDALAYNPATDEWIVVEVKTARSTWDEVPPAYIAQVLHYMDVLQIKRGWIVAVAGMTWNEYEVPFSEAMIEAQKDALLRFWDSLQTETKPAWDGAESTYHAVRMQYEGIDDTEVELGQLALDLINAQNALDHATYQLNQKKSEVLDSMGTAKYGVFTNNGKTHRVASRQMRAGNPSLIVNKKGM